MPTGLVDKLALYTVKVMRTCFDVLSGYKLKNWRGTLSEKCVQNRYRIAVPCRSSPYTINTTNKMIGRVSGSSHLKLTEQFR